MSAIDLVAAGDVKDVSTFAKYAQENLGVPVFKKDVSYMAGRAREFFELNPTANWQTLCRAVHWAKANKYRPRNLLMIVEYAVPKAYKAGLLPELDRSAADLTLDERIDAALEVESDSYWRRILVGSVGQARRDVYRSWCEYQDYLRKVSA